MAFQRMFVTLFPLVLLGSVALPVAAGPQWAPPVGAEIVVAGDSMEPTICAGDLVVYHDGTDITEGDIITFYSDAFPVPIVTHRVVAVTEHGYLTRGDNNPHSDFPWTGFVKDEDVIGEVFLVVSVQGCTDRSNAGVLEDVGRSGRFADTVPSAG